MAALSIFQQYQIAQWLLHEQFRGFLQMMLVAKHKVTSLSLQMVAVRNSSYSFVELSTSVSA